MRWRLLQTVTFCSLAATGSCAQLLGIESLDEGADARDVDTPVDAPFDAPFDAPTGDGRDALDGDAIDAGTFDFVLVDKLGASPVLEQGSVGSAVASDGDIIVVGAPSRVNTDVGAAYVWRRDGDTWVEDATLAPSDGNAEDRFGNSVAISGGLIAVGAPYNDEKGSAAGAVYIFEYVNGTDGWQQIAKLMADDAAVSTGAGLGWSVSVSGALVVAGAPGDDEINTNGGAVYAFKRLGASWIATKITSSEAGYGDHLGWSVSLADNRMAVGVPYADRGETDTGAMYIYEVSNDIWSQQATLSGSQSTLFDLLGWSVSIRGSIAVAGGNPVATGLSGSAYVFEHDGSAWSETSRLVASDASSDDFFGYSVATDGVDVLIGAYGNDQVAMNAGLAYVFEKGNDGWEQAHMLAAADGSASDNLGSAVSIEDGLVCVGANLDDDGGTNTGSLYVFERRLVSGP
ncbi:MAG: hypothetical protein Tsb0020_01430 [Haliangiales bacterium]